MVGEQGLGDEFMFANILPDVQQAVGDKGASCRSVRRSYRLVPLFQRSYPKAEAEVGSYDDRTLMDADGNKGLRLIPARHGANKLDLWAPMGLALQYFRNDIGRFPPSGVPLVAGRRARIAEFREQLARPARQERSACAGAFDDAGRQAGPNISARSICLGACASGRRRASRFVNLQYGDSSAEEIARAEERLRRHHPPHRGAGPASDDIDGAAALVGRARSR